MKYLNSVNVNTLEMWEDHVWGEYIKVTI